MHRTLVCSAAAWSKLCLQQWCSSALNAGAPWWIWYVIGGDVGCYSPPPFPTLCVHMSTRGHDFFLPLCQISCSVLWNGTAWKDPAALKSVWCIQSLLILLVSTPVVIIYYWNNIFNGGQCWKLQHWRSANAVEILTLIPLVHFFYDKSHLMSINTVYLTHLVENVVLYSPRLCSHG